MTDRDYVDEILAQWQRECPEVDVSPIGVIGRLSRLSRILENNIESLYAIHGVQGGRFSVLAALRRSGPPYRLSPTDLANSLLVTSGAMTNRLERLSRQGLITRVRDPHDRRFVMVVLTERGRAVTDRVLHAHLANERALLSVLDEATQKTLSDVLRTLLLSFNDRPRTVAAGDVKQPISNASDVDRYDGAGDFRVRSKHLDGA